MIAFIMVLSAWNQIDFFLQACFEVFGIIIDKLILMLVI
jgi:hypothetical protein